MYGYIYECSLCTIIFVDILRIQRLPSPELTTSLSRSRDYAFPTICSYEAAGEDAALSVSVLNPNHHYHPSADYAVRCIPCMQTNKPPLLWCIQSDIVTLTAHSPFGVHPLSPHGPAQALGRIDPLPRQEPALYYSTIAPQSDEAHA